MRLISNEYKWQSPINFIDFLTDHEKHVSRRSTEHGVAVQDGRLLREPLAKHHPSAKNFMYSALINLSWIPHIAHPLYNHWSYPHTRIPAFYTCRKNLNEHRLYLENWPFFMAGVADANKDPCSAEWPFLLFQLLEVFCSKKSDSFFFFLIIGFQLSGWYSVTGKLKTYVSYHYD